MAGFFKELILRGTRADQPDPDTVSEGTLYFVTDEDLLERSDRVDWESYSPAGVALPIPVEDGGTGADLSATGGTAQFVQQATLGGAFTVGAITGSALPASAVQIASVNITDAQMKALNTTPITIVPAPGAGKIVYGISIAWHAVITVNGGVTVNITCEYVGTAVSVLSANTIVTSGINGTRDGRAVGAVFNTLSATDLTNKGIEVIGSANAGATFATVGGTQFTIQYYVALAA